MNEIDYVTYNGSHIEALPNVLDSAMLRKGAEYYPVSIGCSVVPQHASNGYTE